MLVDFDILLKEIKDSDRVLDLGGWERVFPRANTVVDLLPYESRKIQQGDMAERFTKDDWIVADFCSPLFWENVPDKSYDFITIGHTLEDIRDPLYVCSQMIRCGRAGYIEFPSLFRECSKSHADAPFPGYDHHRWLIEPDADLTGLIFKAKLPFVFATDYLGDENRFLMEDYFFQFDGVFWNGSFKYVEHFSKGTERESENLKFCFEKFVNKDARRNNILHLKKDQKSERDGKCLWVDEYKLPVEVYRETGELLTYPRYL